MKKLLSYFAGLGLIFTFWGLMTSDALAMNLYDEKGVSVELDGAFAGYAVYNHNGASYGKRWQAIGYGALGLSLEKEFETFSVGLHTVVEALPETQYSDNEIEIGEIYASLESEYGRIEAGKTPNISRKMHISTPDVAVMDVDGTNGLDYLLRKDDVRFLTTTAINTDGKKEKVSYISPKIYGLQIASSYIPKTKSVDIKKEDVFAIFDEPEYGNVEDGFTYGVKYSYSGDFDFKLSANIAQFNNVSDIISKTKKRKEYSLGALFYKKGMQLTTSYRHIRDNKLFAENTADGYVADAGIAYEIGPFSTSISQRHSKIDGNVENKDYDRMDLTLLSTKYEFSKYASFSIGSGRIAFDGEDNGKKVGVLFITGIILSI